MRAHVVDRLSAYLDHELSVAEAALVREHLAGCQACAERLAHLAAVDAGVRDLEVVAPEGYFDSFASRVRARVEATSRPRARFQLPAWSWAVAAAVLLAVIVPRLPFGSGGPAPLPAQQTAATDPTTRSSAPARADAGAPAAAAESDRLREIADSEPPAEAGARAKKELLEGGAVASNANSPRLLPPAPPFVSAPPPQATPPARSTAPPAPQTRTAQALPAAPAPAAAPAPKATGFAEGKTDAVSEEVQVAAADTAFRDEVRTQVAAAERSDLEKDKRQNEGAPSAKPQAALAGAGRTEEALKLRRASGEKAASAPGGSAAAEFDAIEA
ncbi:MAG TPA: zf-HC2 domain-containing protein, partial [Vicinamibacteria bacterium]|nr:zf-HC2 domain-containing protein [Vicinamibacteria bacterium]